MNDSAPLQPAKQTFRPSRTEAIYLLPAAALVAALYALCFSGTQILPQISFTLFCPAVLMLWSFILIKTGRFKNNNAFIWALPIILLAAFNGIFHANPFTWGNAMLMHGLFAAFTLTAMREQPTDLFNLSGLLALIRIVFGNWVAFTDVFRAVFVNRVTETNKRAQKIFLGVIIALPFLVIITALLMSADAVFGRLASDLFDTMFGVEWINLPFILTFIIVWVYALGYPCLAVTRSRELRAITLPLPRADTTVCATFLLLVNVVFALFTFIQAAFLFNGGFLQLPGDITYAQYAREGFFQLLFVTVINFSVIIVFMTMLTGVRENKLLRGLLLTLCAFTGVLIASSLYRMGLYTGAYGHTTLRLCVYTFLAMEIVLLGVTVWTLFNGRMAFIRWYVLVGLAFYMIVNVTGSDYFAAKLNAGLFLSGKMTYIDLYPVGPDGLRALRPLIEDEEKYLCIDYRLLRIDQTDYAAYREAYGEPNASPGQIYNYTELRSRVYGSHESYESYRTINHWQNWSYLKR